VHGGFSLMLSKAPLWVVGLLSGASVAFTKRVQGVYLSEIKGRVSAKIIIRQSR
jgi:hypothetical protein